MENTERLVEYKILTSKDKGWINTKIDFVELEQELNTLGKQGWDLVTSFDTNYAESGGTQEVALILKKYIR